MTFGSRGTTVSGGIPGTGLGFQKRFGSTPATQRAYVESQPQLVEVKIAFRIGDDGKVVGESADGSPISPKQIRMAFQENAASLERWLDEHIQEANGLSKALAAIHLGTPPPVYRSRFTVADFSEPEPQKPQVHPFPMDQPVEPVLQGIGFLRKLIPALARRREARDQEILESYRQELAEWEAARAEHDSRQDEMQSSYMHSLHEWRLRKERFEIEAVEEIAARDTALQRDVELMNSSLENALGELEWPLETNIDFDIRDQGRLLLLDVDLPEIEDLSTEEARISANKRRILKKKKSQSALRLEYANHVHGVGLRLIGEAFSALPKPEMVVISAYSQRLNSATGKIIDEYLYSVRADRESFHEIEFDSLERVDPVAALANFEIRRKMTKTGIFKVIQPFSE